MSTITVDFLHYYRKGERRESDQIAYQWDLGHVAEIYVPVNATYEIHYCFADFTETDDYGVESIAAAEDGGYKLTAHIPNELFERSGELKVYVIGAGCKGMLDIENGVFYVNKYVGDFLVLPVKKSSSPAVGSLTINVAAETTTSLANLATICGNVKVVKAGAGTLTVPTTGVYLTGGIDVQAGALSITGPVISPLRGRAISSTPASWPNTSRNGA